MAEGKKRLQRAIRSSLDSKEDKPRLFKGLMGAYVNGNQTLKVPGRPDFVLVRLRGATGEVIQAFNDKVAEVWDLPVLVVRDRRFPNVWRIEGRDIGQYGDWGGASYLPPHGRTHSFTASALGAGSDPVWVFKRQFMPLLPRPNASGTNTIYLEGDYYFWQGRYHYWPGSGTDDLLQYRPTGGGGGRFVTVFMRGEEGIPDYLPGPEFSLIYPPSDPTELILVPDQDAGIPIAAVSLQTGTTRIGWQEIYDLRLAPSILPGTGTSLQIWDEGSALGAVSTVNFVGPNIEAIVSGSFAWVSVTGTTALAVLDEGVPLGNVTSIDFVGGNIEVIVSGSFAWVSVTGTPGGGAEQIGIYGLDDGVPLGTGTAIDWGYGLNASLSGTVLNPSLDTEPNYVWGGSHHFSGSHVRVGGNLYAEDELFVASRVGIADVPLDPYQLLARNPLGPINVLLDAYEAGAFIYVQDTFTDSDDVDLTSHTPDVDAVGGGWLDDGTEFWEISGNRARYGNVGAGVNVAVWIDAGIADNIEISASTTLNGINGGYLGVAFRLDTADETYFDARSKDDTNTYQLLDPDGVLLDSDSSKTISPGDQIDITVELEGSAITATFVNNTAGHTVVLSATSTKHQTLTHHGMSERTVFGEGQSDFFDDFLIKQLATGMVRSEITMRSAAGSTGSVAAQTDSGWGLVWEAHDGSDWAEHARIEVGVPTGSGWGAASYPTQMVFAGGIVASPSLLEWMRFEGQTPELVFNQSGTFLPVRFEGVDDAQLLYINAASGTVGIGTLTPEAKHEVIGGGRYQGDLFVSGTLGLGTDQVPHGGIGWAKATFWGLNASSEGPHMTWVNSADDYPLMQFFMFAHDNFAVLYDGYYDNGFKVSRDDSAFRMYKIADTLVWGMETGVAAGGAASYLDILTLGQNGVILNEQGQLPYDLRVEAGGNTHGFFVDASSGRVGIGTASPGFKLHVSGTFGVSGEIAAFAGDVHVTGSVYSGDGSFYTRGWVQTTDRATPETPPIGETRWYSQSGSAYSINSSGTVQHLGFPYLKWDPDAPPLSPSIYDDEFNMGVLSDAWTEFDFDGDTTVSVDADLGMLRIRQDASSGDAVAGVYRDIPYGATEAWSMVAKVLFNAGNLSDKYVGIALLEDATDSAGDITTIGPAVDSTSITFEVDWWTSYSVWIANSKARSMAGMIPAVYVRARHTTGSLWYADFSYDGVSWMQLNGTHDPGVTIQHIGLIVSNAATTVDAEAMFEFVRFYEGIDEFVPVSGRRIGPSY